MQAVYYLTNDEITTKLMKKTLDRRDSIAGNVYIPHLAGTAISNTLAKMQDKNFD